MEEFIGNIYPQHCGDSLKVLRKTENQTSKQEYLFECEFQKYPYRVLTCKTYVLKGMVYNPQIEVFEFIQREWPQNCGDTLRIIEKTDKKDNWGKYLFKCEFKKYSNIVYVTKNQILKGTVVNSQIEKIEFINKLWLQNCGDTLKILEKIIEGTNRGKFKCTFIKYPHEIIANKKHIQEGCVNNPRIEIEEFLNKIWPQNCGDSLKIIKKSNKKKENEYLWECEFIKYPCTLFARKTCILRGEIDNPNLIWKQKDLLENYLKNLKEKTTLTELSKSFDITVSTIGRKINEFGLRKYIDYTTSLFEKEINVYISSLLNKEIYSYQDNKYEIDAFIKEKNIGFEFNGNYWHSNLFKENHYHQNKILYFKEKNIKIINIWEWEWKNNKNTIKSLIKSKLGIFEKKIGARSCKIKELSNQEYQSFCNQNHLQGECGAKVKLGLFYQNELIQVMSFGCPRFVNNFDWEILRECSKQGYFIIGGKEKLWKYFVNICNPSNCISYCDFSKFSGDSYLRLGFKQERLNKPGFWWYDKKEDTIYWRNPYKHNEYKNKGYLQLYDCGQLVFTWNK